MKIKSLLALLIVLCILKGAVAQPDMTFKQCNVIAVTIPAGRGEPAERVVSLNVQTQGAANPVSLNSITFNLNGTTDLNDIDSLEIFYTGADPRPVGGTLFGTGTIMPGSITIAGNCLLSEGNNYFRITVKILPGAQEGHYLQGNVDSVKFDGQVCPVIPATAVSKRLIMLEHKLLYSGGDYGSVNYRIPAIITADDGTLVTAADARIERAGDLPNNIDIRICRSADMGHTSILDGYDKSRLLFSLASHPTLRKNLTVFLSYDKGQSWGVSKVINPDASGYSSLTILSDGTIGCFYENGEFEEYQLYFTRFSLEWLTDGNDTFTFPAGMKE